MSPTPKKCGRECGLRPHQENRQCGRVDEIRVHTPVHIRGIRQCGHVDRVDSLKGVRRRPLAPPAALPGEVRP